MSELENLIKELCPKGVEYVPLHNVINYIQPTKYIVKDINYNNNYKTPVLTAGQTFILGYTNEQDGIYKASKENPIIIFDDFTASFHWVDFDFKVKSSAIKILKSKDSNKANLRYIFYCMKKINYTPVDHTRQWIKKYSNFKITLPPLEVQNKIIRILDNFTELITELTAELTARKKQYEYYRRLLLNYKYNKSPYFPLKNIVEFRNGKGHEKFIVSDGKYVVINSKFISTNGNVKKYSNEQISPLYKNDILMVMSDLPNGKALAKCFYTDVDNKYTLNQRICALTVKDNNFLSSRYLYYVLDRNKDLLKYDNGVDQTNLKKDDILNLLIPVPDLSEQKKATEILERFDKLCNDFSKGIPAEIEARKKQCEYYRNKLLNFKILS